MFFKRLIFTVEADSLSKKFFKGERTRDLSVSVYFLTTQPLCQSDSRAG
jgi:hypothetical protein